MGEIFQIVTKNSGMKKINLEVLCNGRYRFEFRENGEKTVSRPYENIVDGREDLRYLLQSRSITQEDYYNILGEVYLLDIPYGVDPKEVTDPLWIFSLIGEGRNQAHLEVSRQQLGTFKETLPSVRRVPIFV